MKVASPEVLALLAGNAGLHVADLYTVTLVDGTVIRWSGADRAIQYGPTVWGLGPLIDRSGSRQTRGVEVAQLQLTIRPRDVDLVGGVTLARFIARGGLDGAQVLHSRAYAPDARSPIVGVVDWFLGYAGMAEGGRSEFALPVNSALVKLNTKMPHQLYEPGCNRQVYDAACGVLRAAFTTAGQVDGVPTAMDFDTDLAAAVGYFDLGVLTFTSGSNAGLSRTVKAHGAGGQLLLVYPLPATPAAGDAFSIYPACDKTRGPAGCARFSNLPRFRGFEFVPTPEAAL